jgi:hypothetical protein
MNEAYIEKTREQRKFKENPSLETRWSGVTQIENEKIRKTLDKLHVQSNKWRPHNKNDLC